jgi:hypothetical protein
MLFQKKILMKKWGYKIMSNSSLVSVKVPANTGNYSKGRNGEKITRVTIHHMAGVLSAKQCGNIFAKAGREASSNYGVGKDGEIGLYVDEENRAWTSSSGTNDRKAVTIETSNCEIGGDWKVSDKVLESLLNLVTDICKRNGITKLVKGENLTWHSMFAKTTCPGPSLLSKMDYIANTVNDRLNGGTKPQPAPAPTPEPAKKSIEQLAQEVINGDWGNGEERKTRITNAGYDYSAVQAKVNEHYGIKTSTSNNTPAPSTSIKVGDKVKVKQGAKTYTGTGLASFVYVNTYDVIEVKGDRVVIGLGKAVTAPVNISNLYKV